MSYSTLEAEVEMDRASLAKDRRIAELEAENLRLRAKVESLKQEIEDLNTTLYAAKVE